MLLPMVAGIAVTKQELTQWVYEQGLAALQVLLGADAEELAGPKGKHREERTHYRWGTTDGELSFGGRRIQVTRPRVRLKSGGEAVLPHFEAFCVEDPLPGRVLNQILLGVSTRGYESSLDKPAATLKSRGTSKSAASRHLVTETSKKLEEYLSRRLDELDLAVLMVDGLEVSGHTVVVSLGITTEGKKVPLGLWLGSTENSRVCTAMLQNLLDRGLRIEERILCVIDGGKGIRKALDDVLGDLVVVQRCQLHKIRNLQSHLPQKRHAYVRQTMKEAYKSTSAKQARKRLQALVSWLERNGYDEAAGSLREGMEETLTVLKLGLSESLRRSLATTNAIENLIGTIRRVSRNVKRWKNPSMIRRWSALGVVTAEKKFRRIKGYRQMSELVHALTSEQKSLDTTVNVA
jgi:transposase-like protein